MKPTAALPTQIRKLRRTPATWVSLILCAALSTAASAADLCRAESGDAQLQCLQSELQQAERRLQAGVESTRAAMAAMRSNVDDPVDDPLARFELAQSAWQHATLAACDWRLSLYLGGSLGPPARLLCLLERTQARQQELATVLELYSPER